MSKYDKYYGIIAILLIMELGLIVEIFRKGIEKEVAFIVFAFIKAIWILVVYHMTNENEHGNGKDSN